MQVTRIRRPVIITREYKATIPVLKGKKEVTATLQIVRRTVDMLRG